MQLIVVVLHNMYGFMTSQKTHKATNHNHCLQYKKFMNLHKDSLDTWTASASASTPTPIYLTCSFISHHTWLQQLALLSKSITQHFLITPYHPLNRAYMNIQNTTYQRTNRHIHRKANTQQHPSDSPWQLWHLHKAEHIHVCCRLQSRLHIYHLLHSGSIVPHCLWQRGINNSEKKKVELPQVRWRD